MILSTLVIIFHVVLAVLIVGLVLVQHGKGADAGAAFGAGSSGTVFGAAGKGNFLSTVTKWLVFFFFVTSFSLMVISGKSASVTQESVIEKIEPTNDIPEL